MVCPLQLGKLDKPVFHSWLKILDRSPTSILWLIRAPPEAGTCMQLMCVLCLYELFTESNIFAETEQINSKLKGRILFTNKLAREEVSKMHYKTLMLYIQTHDGCKIHE